MAKMTFKEWLDDADMPSQFEDGTSVDWETGIPFNPVTKAKVEGPCDHVTIEQMRSDISFKLASQRISSERAINDEIRAGHDEVIKIGEKIASAQYKRRVDMIALYIDFRTKCSNSDRAANAAIDAAKRAG